MDIAKIDSATAVEAIHRALSASHPKGDPDFSTLLTNHIYNKNGTNATASVSPDTDSAKSTHVLKWVILGMLTDKSPTLANLLPRHPLQGKYFQDILNLSPDARILSRPMPSESRISSDKKIREPMAQTPRIKTPAEGPDGMTDPLSENLAAAARTYIGRPYHRLNCYELVIQTLEDMGLRYHGTGGLKARLVQSAIGKGLPENAFLTGEGLIAASGNRIYEKRLHGVKSPETEADNIICEIEPLLRKGYILSFSTPTGGHMGIISKHVDRWTFINSGEMDHNVNGPNRIKGVGEESLAAEIRNWVRRAATKKEPVTITLGRLDGMKLVEFSQAA